MLWLETVLVVHLLVSCAAAFGAWLLRYFPGRLALDTNALLFSITSNVTFLASAVLAVVAAPSRAGNATVALSMLLVTIFSLRYHSMQFLRGAAESVLHDVFFMTSGGVSIVCLGIFHLARACDRGMKFADILFQSFFLSTILLMAVVLYFVSKAPLKTNLFWIPTVLAIVIFVTAELVAKAAADHLVATIAVGIVVPAIVTVIHGSVGVPLLEEMQSAQGLRTPRNLVFVDLVCGTFHCVASLTASTSVYLASRSRDSDVSQWYLIVLLCIWCAVPLGIVSFALFRLRSMI